MTEHTAAADDRSRSNTHSSARVIRPLELASRVTTVSGASHTSAITHELVGAEALWMGVMILEPESGVGPGDQTDTETGIYLVSGRIRLRWGKGLGSAADLEAGDIAFVPPRVPHQETNLCAKSAAVWVVVRSRR